jgi:hypothetical protein
VTLYTRRRKEGRQLEGKKERREKIILRTRKQNMEKKWS